MVQQHLPGQRPIIQASWSHSDTPHSVELLWTSDQSYAATSSRQHNTHKRQTSMEPEGFEPVFPESEQLQTHALVRAATGIGFQNVIRIINRDGT